MKFFMTGQEKGDLLKWSFKTDDLFNLKRGSFHKKFSMTGQEICDLLIQVTAC
jgi:hypothetical protein